MAVVHWTFGPLGGEEPYWRRYIAPADGIIITMTWRGNVQAELEAILSRHKEDAEELTGIRDAMVKEVRMAAALAHGSSCCIQTLFLLPRPLAGNPTTATPSRRFR